MAELYKRGSSPYWYARLRDPRSPDGYQRRSTKSRNKAEAREVANALEATLHQEVIYDEAACGLKWLDAVELYLSHADIKDSTYHAAVDTSTVVQAILGDFDLAQLTHEKIRHFCNVRRQQTVKPPKAKDTGRRVSDVTIRRNISTISAVYSTIIDLQLPNAPQSNPFKTFDRGFLKTSRKIDRHLRPTQFAEVLAAMKSKIHKTMLIVLVGTGMRSSELLELRWGEIDFKNKVIEFGNIDPDRTKASRSRRIPLHKEVASALLAHQKTVPFARDALVFANPKTGERRYDLKYLIKATRSRTGINGYVNHGLRHSFASWARQQGLDADAIRRALGHSTTSTTDRYAHHVDDSMAGQFRQMKLPFSAQNLAQTSAFSEAQPKTRKGK